MIISAIPLISFLLGIITAFYIRKTLKEYILEYEQILMQEI